MNQEIVFFSMKFKTTNRQFFSVAVIFFYLLPLLFFVTYSIGLMPHQKSWSILTFGLLLVAIGSICLILLAYYWEIGLKTKWQGESTILSSQSNLSSEKENKVTALDPAFTLVPLEEASPFTTKEEVTLLNSLENLNDEERKREEELALKQSEIQKLVEENQSLISQTQQTQQDFADYKLFSEEQLKQKQLQINFLQQTIEDQRSEMEKRQDQIFHLDTKVHDLSYEIKTLLYLHETESNTSKKEELFKNNSNGPFIEDFDDFPTHTSIIPSLDLKNGYWVKTTIEASALLKKCINMAQKMTGANYYNNETTRYREFSTSNYAIDQRRLFDNLKNEEGGLIVVFSQKDQKLLFANQQSKALLGWSADKLISDFAQIIQEGLNEWRRGLAALTTAAESQIRLLAKNKNGQEVLLSCQLGIIPSGLFRSYVIAIFYPT
ncbi:hypothetical protein [Candidatus Protochlamydia sp. R18]|uniref:hypothetical protein n=1 Tax=Candidatus Protochlamydia sp. R18 TaxID=1353977 RepID=UPI0005A82F8E|nr:hypothetical protein [Candidatus Protochlamydia sp. R18]